MSFPQDFEIRKAEDGARSVIENMIELMRAVSAPASDFPQEQVHEWLGMAMAAAAVTAGVHYGTLAAIGVVANQRGDRKQAMKIIEKNFMSGIDLALRHATRVATDRGAMQ